MLYCLRPDISRSSFSDNALRLPPSALVCLFRIQEAVETGHPKRASDGRVTVAEQKRVRALEPPPTYMYAWVQKLVDLAREMNRYCTSSSSKVPRNEQRVQHGHTGF